MDIHFDWQACDSRVKIAVSPARWCDFCVQGPKKNIRISWFLTFASCPGNLRWSSILFLGESLPECSRQGRWNCGGQGDIMTPGPTESPSVPFFVHLLSLLMEHGDWSPSFEVLPCSIQLLSTSNNSSFDIPNMLHNVTAKTWLPTYMYNEDKSTNVI